MKKFYLCFIICLSMVFGCTTVLGEDSPITFKDYAGIVADSAKAYINSKNDILFSNTKAKIVFVTVKSTNGVEIGEYCENLFDEMGMAEFGRNNSVLFVIAEKENDYSYKQGSNIKRALTDEKIEQIIIESFEPDFSKKHYSDAVLNLFNKFGSWYESEYNNLNLNLDDDVSRYTFGETTADIKEEPSRVWLWVGLGVCIVGIIIVLKIKKNIQVKIRSIERRKLKKKFKIDIDKIVNS